MAHRKVDVDEIVGDEDAFLEPEMDINAGAGASVHSLEVLEGVGRERVEVAKQALSRGIFRNIIIIQARERERFVCIPTYSVAI